MEIDSTYLQEVRSDQRFDYLYEIDEKATPSTTTTTTTNTNHDYGLNISEFFYRNEEAIKYCSYIVMAVVLVIIVVQSIKHFSPDFEADDKPSGMGTDTIYNHDWEPEISRMMAVGKYSEAVVLCYLRWLDHLNEHKIITFSQSKTPGMFMAEVNDYATKHETTASDDISETSPAPDMISKTHRLTDQYLLVRYGHRNASESLAKEMIAL